jgi:hypothetical protein
MLLTSPSLQLKEASKPTKTKPRSTSREKNAITIKHSSLFALSPSPSPPTPILTAIKSSSASKPNKSSYGLLTRAHSLKSTSSTKSFFKAENLNKVIDFFQLYFFTIKHSL